MSILSNYNQSHNTFLVRCLFIVILIIRVSLLLGEEIEYRGRILEFFYEYISAPSPTICVYLPICGV